MDINNKIKIIGDIDENGYKEFSEKLDELELIYHSPDIEIELVSPGGNAMLALAYYSRIVNYDGNVTIVVRGLVASAAILVLAAGDTRIMAKTAWAMVHEDTVVLDADTRVSKAERVVAVGRELEVQWNNLLAERTGTPSSIWATLHSTETFLTASACKSYGLATEILK